MFSKDRALQLDGTLRSLQARCMDAHLLDVQVLFRVSDSRSERQYAALAAAHGARVRFRRERAFRRDLVALLRPAAWRRWLGGGTRVADFVLFAVDDTLFVQDFSMEAVTRALASHTAATGFSLRLGRNTTASYALRCPQRLPPESTPSGGGIVEYRWEGAEGDFGYPLEVSSSVYRGDIVDWLRQLEFRNPNTLEHALSSRRSEYTAGRPTLLCFETSVAFSSAVNRVQAVFDNRHGGDPRGSAESLSALFDRSIRIDVERYHGFVASACHEDRALLLTPPQTEARA